MPKNPARLYVEKVILQLVPTPGGQADFWRRLEALGDNPTTEQLKPLWKDIISNTPLAGRIARQFGTDDPYFLNEVTPAGTDNINRISFLDLTLNSHAIDSTFSILAVAETLGNVSSTFDIGNPSIFPDSLAEAIGNIADIRLNGTEPTSVAGNTLVDKIGKTPLNSGMNRTSIVDAINYVYTHKTPLLFSLCTAQGDTSVTPPYNNATLSNQSVTIVQQAYHANMQGLLQENTIAGFVSTVVDDLFTCIKLVAKIAKGKPGTYTVTNNGTPYTDKDHCISVVTSTITGYVTGTNFNTGVTDPDILPIIVGEICAQYDS